MKKVDFYGDDIGKIKLGYLLKATPFSKFSQINFDGQLTEDVFFEYMYVPASNDGIVRQENRKFDESIFRELVEIDNRFTKVSLIHISGYGGCGKTTYIRHLLYSIKKRHELDIVDYEGAVKAEEPFIERICRQMAEIDRVEVFAVAEYLRQIVKNELYIMYRFEQSLTFIDRFTMEILDMAYKGDINESDIRKYLLSVAKPDQNIVYHLIVLDFLLLLYKGKDINDDKFTIILIDNVDSIRETAEEAKLFPLMKKFIIDCNFFFDQNRDNGNAVDRNQVKDIIHHTKLLFFFPTRIVTVRRFIELVPDCESIYGWSSHEMPEHYFYHKDIISKRVDFFLEQERNRRNSKSVNDLKRIKRFSGTVYKNYIFKRLFNGNIRYCIDRICDIIQEYGDTSLLEESMTIDELSDRHYEFREGSVGIVLSMIMNLFRYKGIYKNKLHLSECKRDSNVSLSRIILTIVREKGGRCSLFEIFNLLEGLFPLSQICDVVWDLSEMDREIWRRLIIFDVKFPEKREELDMQKNQYQNNMYALENYSEIVLCTAGRTYIDNVIPHFEYMLSRHGECPDLSAEKQQPLFAKSSMKKLIERGRIKYLFEKKIDWVYQDVEDCCYNSVQFAYKVMNHFKYSKEEYVSNSFFNYTIQLDDSIGPKQSYESRLIFRHIGYIEKYREYILFKMKDEEESFLSDLNFRLVSRIKRYLELYENEELCFHSRPQDEAARSLMQLISVIEKFEYKDFRTKISI